jgi:hypothetical protein
VNSAPLPTLFACATAVLFTAQVVLVGCARAAGVRMVLPDAPSHKLFYVAADLVKASTLAGMMCLPAFWGAASGALTLDTWEAPAIRKFAIVYCATDAAQFATVKMARSTIWHHTCTSLFGLYLALGGPVTPVCKAMLWYGLCSVVAYLVNWYKAMRVVVEPTSRVMEATRHVARVMYAAELLLNWPIHTYFLVQVYADLMATDWPAARAFPAFAYLFVTWVFVVDDMKLYKFLATAPDSTVGASSASAPTNPMHQHPARLPRNVGAPQDPTPPGHQPTTRVKLD